MDHIVVAGHCSLEQTTPRVQIAFRETVGQPPASMTDNLRKAAGGHWMRLSENRDRLGLHPAVDCDRLIIMVIMCTTGFGLEWIV